MGTVSEVPPTDPSSSIEAFAAVCADLDDPFCDRQQILLGHHLDEATCRALQERWLHRFEQAGDAGVGLADRFAEAYARRRQAIRAARVAQPVRKVVSNDRAAAPSASIAARASARGDAPAPSSSADVDATGYALPVLVPALPFVVSQPDTSQISAVSASAASAAAHDSPSSENAVGRPAIPAGAGVDETAELGVLVLTEPLPFAKARRAESSDDPSPVRTDTDGTDAERRPVQEKAVPPSERAHVPGDRSNRSSPRRRS
jgi:hypothetical protein